MAGKPTMEVQQGSEPVITENLTENPIENLELRDLERYIDQLYTNQFKDKNSVTHEELWIGAKLAKHFGNHDDEIDDYTPQQGKTSPSVTSASELLGIREKKAIKIQRSLAFWNEPKDLLVTLVACCMASLTQGWDQVANGNLGWPQAFGLSLESGGTGKDIWRFGAINAITWFSAAVLGPFLVDPVCHSKLFGRRGAVFLAAIFSFASMIGGSRAQTWQGYMISRLFLGIGIGAKASVVPIWESEILPQAKRGRLLVSWQVFTATGIFAGSVATYILRDNWRNQVLSGALPALILLILTFFCCESPRWLILQGRYTAAFETLVRLRKERILAAEELCYIHFQIQTERYALLGQKPDFDTPKGRIAYGLRLKKLGTLPRNRRAAIASMIVVNDFSVSFTSIAALGAIYTLSTINHACCNRQLSGINILAFLASVFFSTADLSKSASSNANTNNSLGFGIGFGAANAVFSALAYFLIEPLEVEDPFAALEEEEEEQDGGGGGGEEEREGAVRASRRKFKLPAKLHGRRALLLLSLSSGAVVLFIITFLLDMKDTNSAKLPLVCLFIILFTLCYSPGAGCVPFVYSSEVWPNEGREIGMSWAVFWNFLGAGLLALFVPRGFQWGHSRLFGLFTGLSTLGFLLVWLFVPATDHAISLEDMSAKFKSSLRHHGKEKLAALKPDKKRGKAARGAVNGTEDGTADKTPDETTDKTTGEIADKPAGEIADKTAGETANEVEDDKTVD
ncbi:MFS general substrate transporter [Stipitochalara longipes BDJ]|nr:MFS general substrate transporter [Stipitochalara longipes BDJ]